MNGAGCLNSKTRSKINLVSLWSAVFTAISIPISAAAFSLLGPYAPWMDVEKGYQQPGDIGGPMNIGEGYRWNVPAITYGFSRSFLDYFGSNGVAAVESAVAVLNQLPPASAINLQAFTNDCWAYNGIANTLALLDLKSQTLHILLEEMGLADPVRWNFCIRDFSYTGSNYLFYVIPRNFDPVSGQSSPYVNDTLFTYWVYQYTNAPYPGQIFCDAFEGRVDPLQQFYTAASQRPIPGYIYNYSYGIFLTGLSRDDVGGLRYLLSGNQVRRENLLADVQLVSTNGGVLVSEAARPGVEKITFVRHPTAVVSGQFLPFTNKWTDIYYNGNSPAYQDVQRVIVQPDITFSAQDLGVNLGWTRTGTTNWANNAELNGNPGGAGPGVIQPPITILFNTVGPFYLNYAGFPADESTALLYSGWGSFYDSTNVPFVYPDVGITFQPTQVRFELTLTGSTNDFSWKLSGPAYGVFWFQTTTNLIDWTTLATITNSGAQFDYTFAAVPSESLRLFRTKAAQ